MPLIPPHPQLSSSFFNSFGSVAQAPDLSLSVGDRDVEGPGAGARNVEKSSGRRSTLSTMKMRSGGALPSELRAKPAGAGDRDIKGAGVGDVEKSSGRRSSLSTVKMESGGALLSLKMQIIFFLG
ncbi:hypothetical protein RHMOL_Rhmol04G0316700 [Rhododendron molle]|uniref:Uncharacterized protein n=1 Tax=Rhododendron molle TaxID=49168 RepID=A0ACC0P667_RHOML|nr:hypothetical protein RHMOL_Rhmol04G0316700 [Rhododendron molle]